MSLKDYRPLTISLRQMAEKVGISAAYLSELEHGKKVPSLEMAVRLAHGYRCDLELIANIFVKEK